MPGNTVNGIENFVGNIGDRAAVAAAVKGCSRVVHLAGNAQLWARRRAEFDEVNYRGAANVLEEAAAAGAERIVQVSTAGILAGRPAGADPAYYRPEPREVSGAYCMSKLRAEQAAWRLAEAGAPVTIVTPTLPVGPGDANRTPPTRLAVDFLNGRTPALLDAEMNCIDVRDAAAGLVAVLDRGEPGRRYLLGGHNVRLSEWLGLLGAEVGRPPPRWRVPYAAAFAVAAVGEAWAMLSSRPPAATMEGVRLARRGLALDGARMAAELGFAPRPLADSARDAVADYRQRGWLA